VDGVGVGMVCFRDFSEAAVQACGAVSGTTSSGVASCEAPSVSAGGVFTYTLNVDGASGRVSRPVSVQLPSCEPVDVVSYGPVIGAFLLAGVTIVCARLAYVKVFNREIY
jgi:hypothetical protein